MFKWQLSEKLGWNTLFWNNHDLPRIVSCFGDDKTYRVESAKMLALLLYGMKGTPFLYQGGEIGMTNVRFDSISDYRDIETINMYKEKIDAGCDNAKIMKSIHAKSRDNARTPMQWNSEKNAGFTTGEPWIMVNENYSDINVEKEIENENGILHFYKKLIELRKKEKTFVYGEVIPVLYDSEEIFAYYRKDGKEKYLVICNFYGKDSIVKADEIVGENEKKSVIISNYKDSTLDSKEIRLRPYEAMICKIDSIMQ